MPLATLSLSTGLNEVCWLIQLCWAPLTTTRFAGGRGAARPGVVRARTAPSLVVESNSTVFFELEHGQRAASGETLFHYSLVVHSQFVSVRDRDVKLTCSVRCCANHLILYSLRAGKNTDIYIYKWKKYARARLLTTSTSDQFTKGEPM